MLNKPELFCCPIEFMSPSFDEAIELRRKILREPLNIEFFCTDIASEYKETHLGCYAVNTNILMGILSLKVVTKETIKMRQVAVSADYQGVGIGQRLVTYSEHFARNKGFKIMELHARLEAQGFYERMLYISQGAIFQEVGIDHIKMAKVL